MRISDWSSDVCSSDLMPNTPALLGAGATGVCANARVSANAKAQVMALMAAVGTSVEIADEALMDEIGRASCRERVCQYVEISVVAGSLKKKQHECKTK